MGAEPVMDAVIEFETVNAAEFAPKKAAFEFQLQIRARLSRYSFDYKFICLNQSAY
jgi:hypothetical protein